MDADTSEVVEAETGLNVLAVGTFEDLMETLIVDDGRIDSRFDESTVDEIVAEGRSEVTPVADCACVWSSFCRRATVCGLATAKCRHESAMQRTRKRKWKAGRMVQVLVMEDCFQGSD